jgi:hypothetical protein
MRVRTDRSNERRHSVSDPSARGERRNDVPRRERRSAVHRGARRDAAHELHSLDDDALAGLLEVTRTSAASARHEDAPAYEACIAELECEALRRGIAADVGPHEPTPAALALHLFLPALGRGDHAAACRVLGSMDLFGLWRAQRLIRECTARHQRLDILQRVLFRLDELLVGGDRALERVQWLVASGLADEEKAAYVEQCLDTIFGSLVAWGPGRRGEQPE